MEGVPYRSFPGANARAGEYALCVQEIAARFPATPALLSRCRGFGSLDQPGQIGAGPTQHQRVGLLEASHGVAQQPEVLVVLDPVAEILQADRGPLSELNRNRMENWYR